MNNLQVKNLIDIYGNAENCPDNNVLLLAKMLTYRAVLNTNTNDIEEKVKSAIAFKILDVTSVKETSYSYSEAVNKIKARSIYALAGYTDYEIDSILKVYYDYKYITSFNTSSFDLAMYRIPTTIRNLQLLPRFSIIHKLVFSNIINYFKNQNSDIKDTNMKIINPKYNADADYMKEILFRIDNVENVSIVSNILKKNIVINYEDIDIIDDCVWIRI